MMVSVFSSLPLWLGVLLVLGLVWALVRAVLRSAWCKGERGEGQVRRMLRRGLQRSAYVALHNVTLATPSGSTQIDHVVVSRFGIFVIETKNLQGRIEGSADAVQWTQHLHQRSYAFQNPLRQNYAHTLALQETLGAAPEAVHSVIVFVGRCTLNESLPAQVTQGKGCVRFIRSFKQPLWSHAQAQAWVEQLQTQRLAPTHATHRKHVQQLKKRHGAAGQRTCPACGNPMVLRTARAGVHAGQTFWGCSAFPQCKVVQSV